MAVSDNVSIRVAAAGNPITPIQVLTQLKNDASILVRGWILRNPNCPVELLEDMAENDPEKSLRVFAEFELKRRKDVLE